MAVTVAQQDSVTKQLLVRYISSRGSNSATKYKRDVFRMSLVEKRYNSALDDTDVGTTLDAEHDGFQMTLPVCVESHRPPLINLQRFPPLLSRVYL